MSKEKDIRDTLPLLWKRRVDRLKATLRRRNLLTIMDKVLSSAKFQFSHSSLHDRESLRVPLGLRKQGDGVTVPVWAYILADDTKSESSIVFRDEVSVNSNGVNKTRLYPRSAASLLRRATQLRSPFCFLQQEIDDGTKDGRGMLCAVVAYYALIAGLSDCAIRWRRFDACMVAALEYIKISVDRGIHADISSNTTATSATMLSPATPLIKTFSTAQRHTRSSRSNDTTRQASQAISNARTAISNAGGNIDHPIKPTSGNKHHTNNSKSLVVRLRIDRVALAEITGASLRFKVPDSEDEEDSALLDGNTEEQPDILRIFEQPIVAVSEEVSDDIDSVIGDDADSVGDEVDSVIGDASDEQAFCLSSTIRKRKLEMITKESGGEEVEETDGHGWRKAPWGRSNRR